MDLPYGLLVGIIISLFLVVVQNQRTAGYLADNAPGNDVELASGHKVFCFPTNIYYATAERFKSQLYDNTLNPQTFKKKANKVKLQAKKEGHTSDTDDELLNIHDKQSVLDKPEFIILDLSRVCYVDMAGCNAIQIVVNEFRSIEIPIYIAGLNDGPKETLTNAGFFDSFSVDRVCKNILDAIETANSSVESTFA